MIGIMGLMRPMGNDPRLSKYGAVVSSVTPRLHVTLLLVTDPRFRLRDATARRANIMLAAAVGGGLAMKLV